MSTWAGIVRVSKMGDRKAGSAEFHADADQVSDIKRYAAQHGAEVVILPPELDVSGGNAINDRPSLKAAIEGVEGGEFDGIVVAYLSRLTRSRSGIEIWERVEAVGGHVHCAAENTDTSTSSGRFIRDIHLANAVREREERGEQFARRVKVATDAGIWQAPQLPRGYDKDPATRRLVPSAQAAEVAQAFADRAVGVSVVTLATRLGMSPTGVRVLLRNRVYLGELRVGEHVNPNAHPPIVAPAVFEAVQGKRSRPPRARGLGVALLAGMVRCSGCGHIMSRRLTKMPVYGCANYHSGEHCPAPASIAIANLDAYVERIARVELARLEVTAGDSSATVGRLTVDLADADNELAAYLEAVSVADVGAGAFKAGATARRAKRDAIREQLQAEMTRHRLPAIDALNDMERNALMRSLFECVIVRAVGRGRRMPVEQRARVLAQGTPLAVPDRSSGGFRAAGIVPLPLPDFDQPGVLGVPLSEDQLERAGGRRKVSAH